MSYKVKNLRNLFVWQQEKYELSNQIYFKLTLYIYFVHINHFFVPEIKYVIQGNVHLGKNHSGDCSSGNCWSGNCLRGTNRRGKTCRGKACQGNVCRETVRKPIVVRMTSGAIDSDCIYL